MKKGNGLVKMWLTLSLGLVLVALPLLGACAAPPPAEKPSATPPPAAPSPAEKPSATPPPAEKTRLEKLIEGAKKEGEVAFWTHTSTRFEAVLVAFRVEYPFLNVKMWDSRNVEMLTKAVMEAQAGKVTYDLMYTSYYIADMLRKDGLVMEYEWPNAKGWPEQPPHGYWVNQGISVKVPFVNTDIIPLEERPTSWAEVNNPKYKQYGVIISSSSDQAPLRMAALWGEPGKPNWDKAFNYWTEVYQNTEPKVERGYGKPMELIAAGESGLFLHCSWARGMTYKIKGAPVDFVPAAAVGNYRSFTMPKNAPHPNAAILLADFMTTPESMLSISNVGMVAGLAPVAVAEAKPNKLMKEAGMDVFAVPVEAMRQENFQKSEDFWFTMLGLK